MKPETVTAICTAVIALSALIITLWHGRETMKHNRLSVKPALDFKRTITRDPPEVVIDLVNNGIGPAKITDYDIYLNGTKNRKLKSHEWLGFVSALGIEERYTKGFDLSPGLFLSANSDIKLLFIKLQPKDDFPFIRKTIEKIEFQFKYESIYGEKFECRS